MTNQNERRGAPVTGFWVDETRKVEMPDTETDPHMFMIQEGIRRNDLSEALREYRALDTWDSSPWEKDDIGVLATDFINWYRWERL